ncbi:hypothetical protein JIQ42_06619 [Leishmania sp. Namibia]|uniref:hypothetical protein n=1 Tax=Leishmania sp. Namibia TaxID=2802991 RepID=UPI001B784239|nr:hypothetical protein JIQ42_06619 [Leishmania sp. Namibia]
MERRASAPHALACVASAALALALLIPTAHGVVGAAAPLTVTTTPSLPLLDVPFQATPSSLAACDTLFISRRGDCSRATSVRSVLESSPALGGDGFVQGKCAFNVTSAALDVDLTTSVASVPALYWCSSDHPGASVGTLQMNVMALSQPFVYVNAETTVTLSAATPIGTTVGFYVSSTCVTPLTIPKSVTVSATRTVTLTATGAVLMYLCAAIPTLSGSMTALALRGVVAGAPVYTTQPSQGVRHRTISMTSTAKGAAMVALSRDSHCSTLAQPARLASLGERFLLRIDAPAGIYYFCASTYSDIYTPSDSTFTVVEYDVQPHTMYAAHGTPLTYGLNATGREEQLELALSTTTDCARDSLVIPWGASLSWTVPKAGTYYACMRDRGAASTAGYTSQVHVSRAPTLTFSPSPAVEGMPVSATVSHALSGEAVFSVGLSKGGSCDSAGALGATPHGSATVKVSVPMGMSESVTYCVSNPLWHGGGGASTPAGGTVYYALGTLRTRAYRVGHGALRVNSTARIVLDSEVRLASGTSVVLVPEARSRHCADSMASAAAVGERSGMMVFTVSGKAAVLAPVVFTTEGMWLLCLQSGDGSQHEYVHLRRLRVHGRTAQLSEDRILANVKTPLMVSGFEYDHSVIVTSSSACGPSMMWVANGTSKGGIVPLNVQAASAGQLLVCVGYPTASESPAADIGVDFAPVADFQSVVARVYPSIVYVSETTTLSFAGIGGMSLEGHYAFFQPNAVSCGEPASTILRWRLNGPDATSSVSYGTVDGSALERGTVYRVCVGRSAGSGFCDAGVAASVEAPLVSTDPPVPVRGLPVQLHLPPSFTSTAAVTFYVVVGGGAKCSGDLSGAAEYGSGSVDRASGAAAAFVAPARASGVDVVQVCVGSNESLVSGSLGYALGATLRLEQFHTSMVYLQRGVPNVLSGAPMAATGSLYVVACDGAECNADGADGVCRAKMSQGATSSVTDVLDVPLGRYLLCQRATMGAATSVVGSNTTVEVVEPFQMNTAANTSNLRAYVPFAVTMSGGPSPSRVRAAAATYALIVQPASTPCGESAAESQRFTIGGGSTQITITDIEPVQRIRFCVQPSSVDSFEVLTGTLRHYMAPAAVIGDRATTLTSGGATSGATAVLSRTADCLGVVAGGGAASIVDARVTFTVASCGANAALTALYYCETVRGGAYASRGVVGLLRSSGCSGGAGASIAAVDVAPGAAIGHFGIDTAYLASPRLSASSDCGVLLDAAVASVGYAPGVGEDAAFHVCAVLVGDASVTFTTARPTLRVANWALSPTAAVSRYNATLGVAAAVALRVDYATPSSETFLSTARDCSVRTASAAGLSGASKTATYGTTGVRGLVYVCTVAPLSGETVAVAQFLSVTPPAVRRVSPAVVRGGEYSATLVVDGAPPLYSMVPGADSGYTYSSYYTSTSREVYLSVDACSSVLAGTSAGTVTSSGSVSFATAGIAASVSAVALCAGTAAGPAAVLAGVTVARGKVYPTVLVSGALGAPVFIPSVRMTTVQLSASASGCGSAAGMPSFTTDAEGYGAVDLVGGDGGALAVGTYTLCYGGAAAGAAVALESVELVRASHFDVRGTTFVVGVASTMLLLQDLTTAALVPGFSTARDCTSVSSEHGAWAAVASTSVLLNVQAASAGQLLVCVGYPTASESSAADIGVDYAATGLVRSANPRVYPSIVYVSETTTLSFAGIGGMSLEGHYAFFQPNAVSCGEPASTILRWRLNGPDATSSVSYGTVDGSALERGTVYRVCVGRSAGSGFCDAGVAASVEAPLVSTDPPVPVRGLPVQLHLPPSFTSTAAVTFYVVVGGGAKCSGDLSGAAEYGSGSVDRASGAAAAFVAPARASGVDVVQVCVGSNESLVSGSLGYALGATLRLEQFHTSMVYLQRGVPNVLSGAPMAATGSLYVVACDGAECNADGADGVCRAKMSQGATSSVTDVLDVPLGRYLLCQRATMGAATSVVGSNTTVEVVEPFQMNTAANTSNLRAYVPFAVTMSGGPSPSRVRAAAATYALIVQPASTPCGESAAESQRFTIGGGSTQITITDIEPVQRIRFCVQPSSVDSFEVLTGTLRHYMAPAAVIGDRATTLTSGGATSGATAVLSRTADCLGVVAGGGAASIVDARVTFTVASCGANAALTALYYCETVRGGAYASRGVVGLLRSSGCSGGAGASIAAVDVAPGAAIGHFGIDTAYLASPRLSASSDCGVLLDAAVASVGYAPGVGEDAAFHVCAVLVGDASVTFTTARPTLRVANWALSPTAAVSRYNATLGVAAAVALRVDYATPSSETFLSTARDCSVRTASAAGLSGASKTATYGTTGVRGLVYVCTVAPLSGETVAVAQFLSVTPPAVRRVSPAVVRGGEYSATLVVDGAPPLYSMVPGADSGYTYSSYYTSTSREVYLSVDACSSVLAGTSAGTVTSSGSVSFATAGIAASVSAVALCAGTAAGPAAVLAGVTVARGKVYPTVLVSGALGAPVFIPSVRMTTVQLSASASGCGSAAGMPSFTTDAEGYGAVDLVGGDGGALAVGTYTLCYGGAAAGAAVALESVELVRASHFDVRGTTFVVGVASTMLLLQDLTTAALVPGFSTARDCTSVSSEHGAWAAVASTSVLVSGTSVYTAGLYLCARAPVNGTLVALPGSWSGPRSVQFVGSSIQLPSAGWDTCTRYTLDQCYPPGASASRVTSVIAVVYGDCCSASRQSAVVGEASMASGTCELRLDYDKVSAHPPGSAYHVCVWDTEDDSVCTTVSEARVSTNCTRGGGGGAGSGLSRGAVVGVATASGIGGALLLATAFAIWWFCRCRGCAAAAKDVGGSEKVSSAGADDWITRSYLCSPTGEWETTFTTPDGSVFPLEGHELGDKLERSGMSGPVFGDHPVLRSSLGKCDADVDAVDAFPGSEATLPVAPLTVRHVKQLIRLSGANRPSISQQVEMWRRAVKLYPLDEAPLAPEPYAPPSKASSIPHGRRSMPREAEPTGAMKPRLQRPPTSVPQTQQARQPLSQEMPLRAGPVGVRKSQPLLPQRRRSASRQHEEFSFSVVSRELTPGKSASLVLPDEGASAKGAVMHSSKWFPQRAAKLSPKGRPTARHVRAAREQSKGSGRSKGNARQRLHGAPMVPEAETRMAKLSGNARSTGPPSTAPPQGPAHQATPPPALAPPKRDPFENVPTVPAPVGAAPGIAGANDAGAAPLRLAERQSWPLPESRSSSLGSDFDYVRTPTPAHSSHVPVDVSFDASGQRRPQHCESAAAAEDAAQLSRKQSMPQIPYLPSRSSDWPLMYSGCGPTGIGPALTADIDSHPIYHGDCRSLGASVPSPLGRDSAGGFGRDESEPPAFPSLRPRRHNAD